MREPERNVDFFLVLCVSIAPAMYVTGMLQQARYNMKMASYGTRSVSWIVEFYEQNIAEETVRSLFTNEFPEIEKCEFLANDKEIVYFEDKKVQTYVCGVSAGYFDMEGNSLVEGVNPWEDGMYEGKCLIKEGAGLLQYGVEIGDRIRIGRQEYEVSGIIRIPYGYGTVYVPFDSFVCGRSGSFQCKMLISGAGEVTLNEWRQFTYQNTDEMIQVSDAGEIDRMYGESVVQNLRKRTDILSITVVFALLGIVVTSMEKIYEDRYCIGVEMACGANVRQIFSEIMIQNLLIGMMAVLTDMIPGSIGMIFQSFCLIKELNVIENVEMPMGYAGVARRARKERAQQLLELVNLGDKAKCNPQTLSGGERQRVAIARALANNPKVILADEPTGSLDEENGESVLELLKRVNAQGTTVIMVTHDMEIAAGVKRMILIKEAGMAEIH